MRIRLRSILLLLSVTLLAASFNDDDNIEDITGSLAPRSRRGQRQDNRRRAPSNPYSYGYDSNSERATPRPENIARDPPSQEDRQVVAGIPDTTDPCFRRYANCIIVNAQPYERRSSTSLHKCKQHCLQSQTGVYSCRSFVFDNVNQVCDLFAHVGDQAPARLLKFQTRDYFEPTSSAQCQPVYENPSTTTPYWTTTTTRYTPTTTQYIPTTTPAIALASHIDNRHSEDEKVRISPNAINTSNRQVEARDERASYGTQCPRGRKTSFLRTRVFELFNNDDIYIRTNDVTECSDACSNNRAENRELDCRSFDYANGECHLTEEAAVPIGNGQLKQREDAYYYEKICVDQKLAQGCSDVFDRFPQMILVGFAETVTDSPSFEQCFASCLNSLELYGFNCSSGMYYFEESQLNCILNTEDRLTQADLFAEENTDIVDYFEVGCGRNSIKSEVRTHGVTNVQPSSSNENLITAPETQTEWSPCENGIQHRRKDCDEETECGIGLESRACTSTTIRRKPNSQKTALSLDVLKLKERLRSGEFSCPPDECCAVFGGCEIGLRRDSRSRKLEWCKHPCK